MIGVGFKTLPQYVREDRLLLCNPRQMERNGLPAYCPIFCGRSLPYVRYFQATQSKLDQNFPARPAPYRAGTDGGTEESIPLYRRHTGGRERNTGLTKEPC